MTAFNYIFTWAFWGIILAPILFTTVVVAEYFYVVSKYDSTWGSIVEVRENLRLFSEEPVEMLGRGWVGDDLVNNPNNYQVFRYRFFVGSSFHVIFDKNDQVYDRVPTGFIMDSMPFM